MIRVREIVMRDAAGAELVVTSKIDYDKEIIETGVSRRSPPGYELPLPRAFCRNNCEGCSSIRTIDMSLTTERNEFELDAEAKSDVDERLEIGKTAGFSVVSDETIDYPNGTTEET